MGDTDKIELSTISKVKNLLKIEEDIDSIQLYQKLLSFRNSHHPDRFYDEESKKEANNIFIEATQLLKNLNLFLNQEKLLKSPTDLEIYMKDYELINTQQNLIAKESEITEIEKKIMILRGVIKNLLKQNRLLSKQAKENNFDLLGLKDLYKKNSKLKIGIGLNIFFAVTSIILLNIDRNVALIIKYIPFSNTFFNIIIFSIIVISFLLNIRKLIQNNIIEQRSKQIQTAIFISEFSKFMQKDNHFGIKINEKEIYNFIKDRFSAKNKLINGIASFIDANNDIIIEKYKNIFITHLIEKQLIKISKAVNLDREFYVFGSSWMENSNSSGREINSEIIDDSDIDALIGVYDE